MSGERLLYFGDEYYASLAAVRSLRAAGYEPWFAAVEGLETFAERSRDAAGVLRVTGPGADADTFVRELAEHARRLRVAAVLPGTEGALAALAGRNADFPGAVLGAPGPQELARATDKSQLEGLAARAGLRTPPAVDAAGGGASFPAVVKPAQSTVRDDVRTSDLPPARRVGSQAELDEYIADSVPGRYIVQPFLAGTLRAVSGVAWEGGTICSIHQVARRIYPPDCGASAYAETVANEPELDAGVRALLELVGWSGIFELQFIEADGVAYLIDFNPRVYGSIALAIGAGLDLPTIWADLLLGRAPRVGVPRAGVRYRAEERDVRALVHAFRNGRRREALTALVPRPHTVHAVVALRDLGPLGHLVRRAARRSVSRA